jgi:hypothetical protein
MVGRPSKFNTELAEQICNRLMDGVSLRKICEPAHMPDRGTVGRWLSSNPDFAAEYARAREAQGDFMAERMLGVLDRVEAGEIAPDAGRVVVGGLQWMAEKLRPKVYSNKITLAGDAENPISSLALRLDQAIAKRERHPMLDITPERAQTDASDLV